MVREKYEYVFFQAEGGIRVRVRARGLGDVYKRQKETETDQGLRDAEVVIHQKIRNQRLIGVPMETRAAIAQYQACLLYTSDAADERSSVDLGGRRIIKKPTPPPPPPPHTTTQRRSIERPTHNARKLIPDPHLNTPSTLL